MTELPFVIFILIKKEKFIMNSVVVVESPAKAKTIEGYLGDSYSVIASFGHVRDMEDKDGAVLPGSWSEIKWSLNDKGKKQVKEILKTNQKL